MFLLLPHKCCVRPGAKVYAFRRQATSKIARPREQTLHSTRTAAHASLPHKLAALEAVSHRNLAQRAQRRSAHGLVAFAEQ